MARAEVARGPVRTQKDERSNRVEPSDIPDWADFRRPPRGHLFSSAQPQVQTQPDPLHDGDEHMANVELRTHSASPVEVTTSIADDGYQTPAGYDWPEANSARFLDLGRVYTPRRDELRDAFLDLIPALPEEGLAGSRSGRGRGG